jgi:hypothetical protein
MNRSSNNVSEIIKSSIQIIVILTLLVACTAQETELMGTYKSADPNLVKKAWKYVIEGYDGFITGTELELRPDSSFHMVTCGNILTGTWSNAQDSLYLTYQTNRWRSDSLQEFGLDGKWPELTEDVTEAIEIKGNQLIISSQEDGTKFYDVLEK